MNGLSGLHKLDLSLFGPLFRVYRHTSIRSLSCLTLFSLPDFAAPYLNGWHRRVFHVHSSTRTQKCVTYVYTSQAHLIGLIRRTGPRKIAHSHALHSWIREVENEEHLYGRYANTKNRRDCLFPLAAALWA